MCSQAQGRFASLAASPTGSRVLQACIKYGGPEVRRRLWEQVSPALLDLAKTPYGHFLACKLIATMPQADLLGDVRSSLHWTLDSCRDVKLARRSPWPCQVMALHTAAPRPIAARCATLCPPSVWRHICLTEPSLPAQLPQTQLTSCPGICYVILSALYRRHQGAAGACCLPAASPKRRKCRRRAVCSLICPAAMCADS